MDVIGPAPLQAWVDTYNAVKAQGLIPGFPNATAVDGWPVYGRSINPADPDVCSFSLAKCTMAEDIVNAPNGTIGISFDDGPQLPSPGMYDFLSSEGIPSTHFVIGSRIVENPSIFQQILAIGGHLAVHTWSHPLMSTLNDMQVLGELGWTMQIIHDQANGLVPAYWRPPYGDVDMRVRAIAKNVFGLTTVLWNQDSKDWCLSDDGTEAAACAEGAPQSDSQLARELRNWFTGDQTPGLIVLEHEHHNRSIQAFRNAYPLIQSSGWSVKNIPQLLSANWYANAADNAATPSSLDVGSGLSSALVAQAAASLAATQTSSTPGAAPGSSGTAAASNSTIGWTAMSKGAQIGIIAGASAAGLLLLALLGFCLWRRRRNDRHAPAPGLAPISRPNRFSQQHSYNRFDSPSPNGSFEKVSEKAPLPLICLPLSASPTPTIPTQTAGFLGIPERPRLDSRLSSASVYSQGTTVEDPFASSPAKARKSAFHLPNRFSGSPYAGPPQPKEDWI